MVVVVGVETLPLLVALLPSVVVVVLVVRVVAVLATQAVPLSAEAEAEAEALCTTRTQGGEGATLALVPGGPVVVGQMVALALMAPESMAEKAVVVVPPLALKMAATAECAEAAEEADRAAQTEAVRRLAATVAAAKSV